jgi:D-glycero-alpha-D-manno-heptose 1-phosphate guanylyltransferase
MINEAIILAGGLGTRLRSHVPDVPKCMAPVAGKPFLSHVLDYYVQQGIESFVFALGYKSEMIIGYLASEYPALNSKYSIETELLGTGGAIKLACEQATTDNLLVLNGDTIFRVDMKQLSSFHFEKEADCTLSLKPMENFDRYGVVVVDDELRITQFSEKKFYSSGLINGGVYALNSQHFLKENLPRKFSFEKEYLEAFFTSRNMFGQVQDKYFIDIGIPADYDQAQSDFLAADARQS